MLNKLKLSSVHKLGLSLCELEKVEFIKIDDYKNYNAVDGSIAVFTEPIYLTPEIRLSPLYPNIGVSEDGRAFDRFTLEELPITYSDDPRIYPLITNPRREHERLKILNFTAP